MIIERKYEYFWRLIERDPKVKEIYEEACRYKNNKTNYKKIYEYNLWNKAFELELGCGIINPYIIWDGLKKLDEEEPYDNGFNWGQVRDIEILACNIDGDEKPFVDIAYIFTFDGAKHIVAVEHKE